MWPGVGGGKWLLLGKDLRVMTLLATSVQTLRPTGKHEDTQTALCSVGDGKRGAAHMKFWQRRLLFDGSSPDMWDCMKHWVITVVLEREMCVSNRLTVVCSSSWSYTFPSALYVKSTSLCPCLSVCTVKFCKMSLHGCQDFLVLWSKLISLRFLCQMI